MDLAPKLTLIFFNEDYMCHVIDEMKTNILFNEIRYRYLFSMNN
jgi:hypothetical protein